MVVGVREREVEASGDSIDHQVALDVAPLAHVALELVNRLLVLEDLREHLREQLGQQRVGL